MGRVLRCLSGLSEDFYAFPMKKPDVFAVESRYLGARQNGNNISNCKMLENRAVFEFI
jgi:hypothetical protein